MKVFFLHLLRIFLKEPQSSTQDCRGVIHGIPISHVWEYPKYWVIPKTSGLPEISEIIYIIILYNIIYNIIYIMIFRVARYQMIFKTE